MENFIRSIALDAARHFECTDTAATLLIEALCAEGNLELWDWIQVGSHDSKDEMERVRLPQKLCHAEGKTIDEIATLLYISGMSAARLVGYHIHFLSVFDL